MILLCPYTTHRHPAFWEQPEVFDPLRFTPERVASRPHYAYFPFGGGPRLCIGNAFAMMEAHLILATVAQRYRLCLGTDVQVEPEPLITLRPRGIADVACASQRQTGELKNLTEEHLPRVFPAGRLISH